MGNQHSSARHDKCIITSVAPNLQLTVNSSRPSHPIPNTCPRINPPPNCQQNIKSSHSHLAVLNLNNNRVKKNSPRKGEPIKGRGSSETADQDYTDSSAMNKVVPVLKPTEGAKAMIAVGNKIVLTGPNMSSGLEKFAKCLVQQTGASSNLISKEVFHKHVIPKSRTASRYVWDFFNEYSEADVISETKFLQSADKIYAQITDKEQVHFYMKMFGKGSEFVQRKGFYDFLGSAYQLSSIIGNAASSGLNADLEEDGNKWMESVAKSCFHIKEEMSVFFLSNWIMTNLPRVLIGMHKYIVNQLTTGHNQLTKPQNGDICSDASVLAILDVKNGTTNGISKVTYNDQFNLNESQINNIFPGVNPVLLWLLSCSLPDKYLHSDLKPKTPEHGNNHTTQELIKEMTKCKLDSETWTVLYDSDEHGTSINRFQHHVFNYRGPNLMFITADNGYQLCLGSDTEWKESCHFWGGEDSIILQLQPEFRIVERGEKILYSNFSIRGYPFGIQAGKDARNVSVDIKPDFQFVSFKKMPCKIEKFMVYGCGNPQAKNSQTDYKKWEAKECQKQRTININSAEWNDNPDKYLLELGGNYKSYGNN